MCKYFGLVFDIGSKSPLAGFLSPRENVKCLNVFNATKECVSYSKQNPQNQQVTYYVNKTPATIT